MARWRTIALFLLIILVASTTIALTQETKNVPLFSSWGKQIGWLSLPVGVPYSSCQIVSNDLFRQALMGQLGKDPDGFFQKEPLQVRCN